MNTTNFERRSTNIIFRFIIGRCKYEKRNTIKIEQTYIAEETLYSRQTVYTELKYLQEQGYITYKRALYRNLTTTQISLTDKSLELITPHRTQNKPQDLTQTEETQEIALKPSNNVVSTSAKEEEIKNDKLQEVLDILNYQARRFVNKEQNEFEFRRTARYIVEQNKDVSANIRFDYNTNTFINVV